MKKLFEKKVNKTIIGVVLWSAVLWLWGFGMSPKWKNFFKRIKDRIKWTKVFLKDWFKELKKNVKNKKNLYSKKRK